CGVVGRHAMAEPARKLRIGTDAASAEDVEALDNRVALLDVDTLQTDVGNPVLSAGVRASGDIDPESVLECRNSSLQFLRERNAEVLRLREGELAELRARARYGAALKRRPLERNARC